MASLRDHERHAPAPDPRPLLLRILVYSRPYLGLVALTLVIGLLASTTDFARAYLAKPLIDEVVVPFGASATSSELRRAIGDLPLMERFAGEVGEPEAPAGPEDAAALGELRRRMGQIALAALVLVFVFPVLTFASEYTAAYALGRMNVDMKRDACAKLLALPLGFHLRRRRGDVHSRAIRDVEKAHSALSLLFEDIIQSALAIVVGVSFLLYVSWKLALISFMVGPVLFGVISFFGRRIRRSARQRQRQFAEVNQRLLEILAGIKVIKAFRAEATENRAYRRETRKLFRRSMGVVQNRLLARNLVEMLNLCATLGALVAGIGLMGWLAISVGDLAAFFLVSSQAYRPLKKLARAWVRVMDSMASAERFCELLDSPVDIRDAPDARALGRVERHVAMRGVWFDYGAEPVLRNVSFEVPAGETVAVVGRTGAGKTTLTDLLLRFYDPTRGSVEIDGVDLRRISRDSLLAQIGVVTQEPFLFDGTIWENLLYGRPDASDAEVHAAARAAHVDEFVRELAAGYGTEVGPTGVRLSGGQRQRITIGRAILKDPSILIFDEATSSLDAKSEKYVQDAIESLLVGQRTVVVIAHRLSTIRRADRILVLEHGVITQQGSHTELLAQRGLYRELIELQTFSEAAAS